MTDEHERTLLHDLANTVVKQVMKKTGIMTALAVAGVIVMGMVEGSMLPWWSLPAGILLGAVLGVLNFKWLAQTVEQIYTRTGMTPTIANVAGILITILKLMTIFVILFIVIKWQLVHTIGLVVGLSLCFAAIIWQGFGVIRRGNIQG